MHAAASNTLGISANTLHAGRGANNGKISKKTRFDLLRVSQSILYESDLSAQQQKRVVWCNRTMMGDVVPVYRAENGTGSRFSSLHTCGSVWHCPVCAAKVAESRREELQAALATHKKRGGTAYLLTLTFPHELEHEIFGMLEKFDKARTAWKNSRTYKGAIGCKREKKTGTILEQGTAGAIGAISSLEVTYSERNGWHPHLHMLIFCNKNGMGEIMFDGSTRKAENGDLQSSLIDDLKSEWVRLLIKNGLGSEDKKNDMLLHGLNVRGGEYAAEYIAKFGKEETWTLEDELTRGHAKIGAAGIIGDDLHFTPFQLLTWAKRKQEDGKSITRRSARELFKEYANAFHGKRMLTWSPFLAKDLDLTEEEKTDEELAAAPLPDEIKVGVLTDKQFAVLLTRNSLGDFLRYVADSCIDQVTGQSDIDDYIKSMELKPATHGSLHRLRRAFGSGFNVAENCE